MIEVKQNGQDSQWQIQNYQTGQLYPKQCIKVVEAIKKINMQNLQVAFHLKTYYQLQKFAPILQRQISGADQLDTLIHEPRKPSKEIMRKKIIQNSNKLAQSQKKYPYCVDIEFQNYDRLQIFQSIFDKKLKEMENIYMCQIRGIGKILKVFLEAQNINTYFKNQIWDMMNSLTIYYDDDKKVIDKLKYSLILANNLKKKQVHFIIKKRRFHQSYIVFYSTQHKKEAIKKIVHQQLIKDIFVIKMFNDLSITLSKYNAINFKLLTESSQELIKKIKDIYEIQTEIDYNYGTFVLHVHHSAFQDVVYKEFNNFLGRIYLFEIVTLNARKVYNQIKKCKKQMSYLRVILTTRKIFLCIDMNKMEDKKQIIQIFKGLLIDLSLDTIIGIYLGFYYELNNKERDRIISLPENYGFKIDEYNKIIEGQYQRLNIKLKSIDDQKIMQNRFINFFMELFTQTKQNQISLQQSKIMIGQSQQILDQNNQSINNSNILNQFDKTVQFSLKKLIQYVQPKRATLLDKKIFDKDKKRNIDCENRLKEHLMIQFRIWSLTVCKSYKFDYNKDDFDGQVYIVDEIIDNNQFLKYEELIKKNLNNFAIKEVGYIIFVDKNNNYIPSMQIERSG